MLRAVIAGGLATLAVTATAQQKPIATGKPAQNCRIAPTESRTHATGPGMTMDSVATCSFDAAAKKVTCTNRFKDSRGIPTTGISVTTYTSVDDLIEEAKVVPPLRRSLRTETTTKTNASSITATLVNSYDSQKRLIREVGTGPKGVQSTTTYSSWDAKGRPTLGTTVHPGGKNSLTITYNDSTRTQTTTTAGLLGQSLSCSVTFDANGNAIATSCLGAASGSKTTITATDKICR
jgi:hypothetical protein